MPSAIATKIVRGVRLPAKDSQPTLENIGLLEAGLTSVIAGHPGAIDTYTFYEVLDDYLGPWGENGYPLGYGKYYNIQFTQDPALKANDETREWVWRTTILLQECLRDFVLQRFKVGTLATLTEPELRQAAFDSHPAVYTQAGLAKVVMLAPYLVPWVAAIPYKEFSPVTKDIQWNDSFSPTIKQVFITIGLSGTTTMAVGLAALMPAHSGFLRNAMAADERNMWREMNQSRELGSVREALRSGKCDNLVWLNKVTDRLNHNQYSDQRSAGAAREVVELANARKRRLAQFYRLKLKERPDLRPFFDRT
jgi:hypothetical protein